MEDGQDDDGALSHVASNRLTGVWKHPEPPRSDSDKNLEKSGAGALADIFRCRGRDCAVGRQ